MQTMPVIVILFQIENCSMYHYYLVRKNYIVTLTNVTSNVFFFNHELNNPYWGRHQVPGSSHHP